MKWDKPNGSVQSSADGRYVVVQANSKDWIAYELTPYSTGKELAVKPTDAEAREACENHEAMLVSLRRQA